MQNLLRSIEIVADQYSEFQDSVCLELFQRAFDWTVDSPISRGVIFNVALIGVECTAFACL